LLRAGVKIYERRGVILHSKTALIDGVWATVGSTNLDWRSFLHNYELNAVVLGAEFGKQMQAMFDKDLEASDAITLEQWERRGLTLRVKEFVRTGVGVLAVSAQERLATNMNWRFQEGADGAQIADEVAAILDAINAALTPIIGQRGVAAIYTRSLHLAVSSLPWLQTGQEGIQAVMDLTALKSVLAQQSSADAAVGGKAVLQTFFDILVGLIGPSLTEQLLRPAWEKHLSGPTA
jgi:hypothetical protein